MVGSVHVPVIWYVEMERTRLRELTQMYLPSQAVLLVQVEMERTRLRELTHLFLKALLIQITVEMERTRLRELTHHRLGQNPKL